MHPAISIILFTTLSGAGLGLGFWFGLLSPGASDIGTALGAAMAIILTGTGLCCSLLHLRRPLRAWRALSQWRSSWLSREGILAPAGALVIFLHGIALWQESPAALWLGWLAALLCVAAVFATSMIYAPMRAVPAWNTPLTPLVFLSLAAGGGATIACALPGVPVFEKDGFAVAAIACTLTAWVLKFAWWKRLDRVGLGSSTPETATGLGSHGRVRLLERPHTGSNYLLDEMGYVVARRHATKLRRIALTLGCAIAVLMLLLGLAIGNVAPFAAIATVFHLVGTGISRWLFFAEARHVVTLYY